MLLAHAILMLVAFGVLLPMGLLLARHKWLFVDEEQVGCCRTQNIDVQDEMTEDLVCCPKAIRWQSTVVTWCHLRCACKKPSVRWACQHVML